MIKENLLKIRMLIYCLLKIWFCNYFHTILGALKKIVMWNEGGITTQLPVQPDDSISIPISLYGYNHFYTDSDNSEGFFSFLYLI